MTPKFLAAAVIGTLGLCGSAYAEQAAPAVPDHPVVAQRLVVADGQQYPVFLKKGTPLVVERWLGRNGEQYPDFVPETRSANLR